MAMPVLPLRRAMTLVELLVVIVIIGLLGVAVAPLFQARSERRKFVEAGGIVSAHFNAVIARSIGSAKGEGVWLGVAPGSGNVATRLTLTRPRPHVAGDSLRVSNPTHTSATVDFGPNVPVPARGVLHVAGYPTPYLLHSATEIRFLPGYSADNSAFPAELPPPSSYSFWASIPPRERITSSARELGGDFCVDFNESTIGVYGYSGSVERLVPPLPAPPVETLAIIFDPTGRATMAWTFIPSRSPQWEWYTLDSTTPIALFVGQRSRAGLPVVDSPSEAAPGSGLQNPDAVWVVIDPRATLVRTIPNNPVPNSSILNPIAYAQSFVVEALTK